MFYENDPDMAVPSSDSSDSESEAQEEVQCDDLLVCDDQTIDSSISSDNSESENETAHEQQYCITSDTDLESKQETTTAIQHFDPNGYKSGPAFTPLYEGADITLLEAIAQHLLWFTEHPSTSKHGVLELQHRHIFPPGNVLPHSYKSAMKVVNGFLVKPLVFLCLSK